MASQHLLFEEDGAFKAGTVLAATDASYQVELASGKRTKVKSGHVLLRFTQPTPPQLMQRAQADAAAIDLDFLWECAPQREFDFDEMAREYHGHEPNAVEAASILLRLHGAPVYFHRKGRGRFRPAPPEILQAALAAVERKRRQEALRQEYVDEMKAGGMPPAIAAQAIALLVEPDRNSIEYKALEQAAAESHLSPLRLLLARGAIASPRRWHVDAFLASAFPRGVAFPSGLPSPSGVVETLDGALPLAAVEAFSIDDSTTTEIDDAFSLQPIEASGGAWRIGIHIAAPALAIRRGDELDAVARGRMSTVYAPGLKYTMLPEAWIEAFSLNAGRIVPVLSLYVDVDPADLSVGATRTVVERIRIRDNLRHDRLDEIATPECLEAGGDGLPRGSELAFLWRFARRLLAGREAVRGRPEPVGRTEYSIALEGDGDDARVEIRARRRGAPLDLMVAELMILANSHWGGWLAQKGRAAIYRSQARGPGANRVRMGTTPAPHAGIGVEHYAWSTSPLRRYVDLVNQRQLIAAASDAAAPYVPNDAELFAVVSGFDAAYTSYNEFQDRMERFWCLRWLRQNDVRQLVATVLKGDLLRVDGLPWVGRLPGLPDLPRATRIRLDVLGCDEVDISLQMRLAEVLRDQPTADDAAEDEDDDEERAAAVDAAEVIGAVPATAPPSTASAVPEASGSPDPV
ncbi:MAG TPA: ribonuclease catalytic domain-containing protein [Burkholderiaceae bacterium]|nr:ribonuclease catalytic domain-containing protein [Burkholderiaceae bacterium]